MTTKAKYDQKAVAQQIADEAVSRVPAFKPEDDFDMSRVCMSIRFTTRIFGNTRKDKRATSAANEKMNATADAGVYRKNLIDPACLKEYTSRMTEARNYYYAKTLGYAAPLRLVPVTQLDEFRRGLADHMTRLDEEANRITMEDYPRQVALAQQRLGEMFDPSLYPTQREFRAKFGSDLKMRPMPTSRSIASDLMGDAISEVRKEIDAEAGTLAQEASREAWRRLLEPLAAMKERLNFKGDEGKPGDFRSSMIENIKAALEEVNLNVVGDPQLEVFRKSVLEQLDTELNGDWRDLRDEPEVAKEAAEKVDNLLAGLGVPLPATDKAEGKPKATEVELGQVPSPAPKRRRQSATAMLNAG